MGSFESYVYADGDWGDSATDDPWLSIALHDSDFATIRYSPAPEGFGLFYVGYQPSDYFKTSGDGDPVDVAGEAAGIADWAAMVADAEVAVADVLPFVAPAHRLDDPEDVFVEWEIQRLLVVLGIPIIPLDFGDDPEDLPASVGQNLERWAVQRDKRIALGDNLIRPRSTEHLAAFRNRADAERAAAALEERGFTVLLARSLWRVLLQAVRTDTLTEQSVTSFLGVVVSAVEANGGKYDGFSGEVVG